MENSELEIYAADLFAGAGGMSTGLIDACRKIGRKINLTAINHWPKAIETHSANYPWATHLCEEVQFADPRTCFPGGHLDLLVASPSCIFYSRAAGGRPKRDQRRSSAWDILRWPEYLDVDSILVENVPEFQKWSGNDKKGNPIIGKVGETFRAWISAIESYGYKVEYKILNAADYGAPTSRRRLFIMAKKKGDIHWPEPQFSKDGIEKPKWRAAKEIINWSLKGESIFQRNKPLSPNTIRRIICGLRRFGGPSLEPFIVLMEHRGGIKSIHEPLPTITTAKGGAMALVDPFVLSQASGGAPRSTREPLPTIPAGGAHALIEPFILPVEGFYQDPQKTHNPPRSIDEPLTTITQRGGGNLVEFIMQQNHNSVGSSIEKPVPSMTAVNHLSFVESYLLPCNARARSVDEPVPTITARDRIALVQPEISGYTLDIRFRMLQPRELSNAMGFPASFEFKGTKEDIVRQIGNAVAVDVSKALCLSLLGDE